MSRTVVAVFSSGQQGTGLAETQDWTKELAIRIVHN